MGGSGLSFDIRQGCDLLDLDTQVEVDAVLDEVPPELLVCCLLVLIGAGGIFSNALAGHQWRARLIRHARQQVKFCVAQFHKQLKRSKHFLFEHPIGSSVWRQPEMRNQKRKFGLYRVDMCAYGLKCPESKKPVRKGTGIICSDRNFAKAVRRCTEPHQVAEGTVSGGQSRCALAAEYTPQFVDIVWRHVGPQTEVFMASDQGSITWPDLSLECLAGDEQEAEPAEVTPQAEESPEEAEKKKKKIDAAIRRLHSYLGHPSHKELVRVLKHSGASELASQRATQFSCPVCANHQRPSAALPANTSRVVEFNAKVGMERLRVLILWIMQRPCR